VMKRSCLLVERHQEDIPGFRIVFDKMTDMWICQCMAMYYRPPPSSSMSILGIMTSSHHMSNDSLVRQAMSGDRCVKEEVRRKDGMTIHMIYDLFKVSLLLLSDITPHPSPDMIMRVHPVLSRFERVQQLHSQMPYLQSAPHVL
jgi:hypothetical protein